MMLPKDWRFASRVLAIFMISVFMRCYLVKLSPPTTGGYPPEMVQAALSWADEAKFTDIYGKGTGESAHVAPLYPIMLGTIYRVAEWVGSTRWMGQFVLAVLGTSIGIALVPVLGRSAGLSSTSGLAAGMALAISPLNYWTETSGDWEQPFSCAVLIGLLMTFIGLHRRRWASWPLVITAGLLVGITALLSPSLLLAPGLMLLSEFGAMKKLRGRVALRILVLLAVACLCLVPWTIRNYRVLGGFVPIRSNFGLELRIGNNPGSDGRGRTFGTDGAGHKIRVFIHPANSAEERAELLRLGELNYMREQSCAAIRWISENPGRFTTLTLQRIRFFWFPPVDMWPPSASLRRWKSGIFTLTGIAAFLGLGSLFLVRNEYRWLLASALIGPSLPYFLTHVDMRYRYPVWGLSFILSVHLICMVFSARRAAATD
jgi:hypothetical protein